MGGIVMMAYAEGFEGPNAVGVILSVAAAIGAALYKVIIYNLVPRVFSLEKALGTRLNYVAKGGGGTSSQKYSNIFLHHIP